MAEPIKTDIDNAPDWWNAWFDADYSWEGLARLDEKGKPVHPWVGWVVVDEARCVPEDEAPENAGKRPATLQDYWRADPEKGWGLRAVVQLQAAGELLKGVESPDGRTWHIAHVPPGPRPGISVAPDKQKDWFKADLRDAAGAHNATRWNRLRTLLDQRLTAAAETQFDRLNRIECTDRRAQFDGVVIRVCPAQTDGETAPLHLSLRRSAHLLNANFQGAEMGPGASYAQARFAGSANFQGANFAGHAYFRSASFGGIAHFRSASFGGMARFRSASFGRIARFRSASFAGNANFDNARFAGSADFRIADFTSNAGFRSVGFASFADFRGASFGGSARFRSASFAGNAYFQSASFAAIAEFRSVIFLGLADFHRGRAPALESGRLVRGERGRDATSLTTSKVELRDNDFVLIMQDGSAKRETGAFSTFNFENGLALGGMRFHDRVFGQQPDFTGAQFLGPLEFFQAELHDGVLWHGAEFHFQPEQDALSWHDLVSRLTWRAGYDLAPSSVRGWASMDLYAMNSSARQTITDPIKRRFWISALRSWRAYTKRSLAARKAATSKWADHGLRTVSHVPRIRDVKVRSAHLARDFEQAYRRLKLLMRQQGSHLEEQKFFELELRARQARDPKTDKDVKRWEVWGAALYGAFAEYGSSIARPVLWLLGVWLVAAVCYGALAHQAGVYETERAPSAFVADEATTAFGQDGPGRFDGVRRTFASMKDQYGGRAGPVVFAAEITLAPVANPIRQHDWAQRLEAKGDGWSAAFSALRLIHRLFAIPLLFLFALALRRRFQLG